MEEHRLSRQDLSAILRRRKYHILIPLVVLMMISIAIAYGLPPVYRSSATILIVEQEIPQDLVRSTVNNYAAEQIQVITQRVLTYDNLLKLSKKYNLYPGLQDEDPATAVEDLREAIAQDVVSADVIDPKTGRPAKAVIAFTLSVDANDAQTSKKLANEVVDLYLNENKRLRNENASGTTVFLEQEAGRLGKEISELEGKLAAFKKENVTTLPTLMDFNMGLINRAQTDIAANEKEIQTFQERAAYLESQLAQTEPMAPTYDDEGKKVLAPAERLKSLQAQYMQASSLYSPDHPDVIRMRREIEALKRALGVGAGSVDSTAELSAQLAQAKDELKAARDRYSADHPDVIRLKRSVASLEAALRKARKPSTGTIPGMVPDNPTYVALQTELKTVTIGLQAAMARRDQLRAQLADYEKRIVQTPQVEQEYLNLSRDYDNAKKKYAEVRDKLLQARMAQELEKENRGEQLSVIEPPRVPDTPVKPNRLAVLFLGMVISLGGGAGAAAAAEHMDRTVRGPAMVTAVLKVPPLAVIPYLDVEERVGWKRRELLLFAVLAALVVVSAAVLLYMYGAPTPPQNPMIFM